MVEYVTKFQCILVILVSSRRFFFITDYVIYKLSFSVSRDVLAISRLFSRHIFKAVRFFFIQRECQKV